MCRRDGRIDSSYWYMYRTSCTVESTRVGFQPQVRPTDKRFGSSGNVGGKIVFRAKIGGSPQDALERTRRQAHALLGVPRTSMELNKRMD